MSSKLLEIILIGGENMKYPFERQSDLKDCGVCSLLMLIRYYGGGVSKEYLRNITNTTKEGVSAYSLIEAAKTLGFDSFGAKGNIEKIEKKYLPCIAHVVINKSYQHFVVIYNIDYKKKILWIADPSKNKISKMTLDEFNKISTNQFIFLKPRKKICYVKKNTVLRDYIMNFIACNSKKIILILLFSIIVTVFNIISSFQFKILIEYVINYQNIYNLFLIFFIFLSIILIKEISNYYRNLFINDINHKLDKSLISNIYHRILSLPYLYYKNRTTGEIVARMDDLASIRNVVSKLLVTVFLDLVLAVFTLFALLFLNVKLTLIIIITIIFIIFIILLFKPILYKKISKSKEEAAKLNSFLVETINGIETIKNQNVQNFIEKNFLVKYCTYNRNSLSYNKIFLLEQFLKDFVDRLGTFLVLIIGSYLVVKGHIDISILITYITLMSYLLEPIKNIIDLDLSFKEAKVAFQRISELYEVEEELKNNHKKSNFELSGKISSNHLMYSYNGKDLFLKNINLEINPGDKVLIYGSSGSGKSTLAKILSKQLNINNNLLYYDDKDINNFSLEKIREEVCYISQQEILFTDSIYQNIILDKQIDYNDFLDIAKLCMIDEFVEKNILAYDTLLEENGFNLSGGQRQRIILARALLKKANIYILDESLNEVDIKKERQILQNIFNTYKDKTFIIISHRFHNQDLFNKKYRIDQGVSYEESV